MTSLAELDLELIRSHMAQKRVLRGEVGCVCVAREVSVERGGMGERGCARRLDGWVWVRSRLGRVCVCGVRGPLCCGAPPCNAPHDPGMCWKQFMMCLEGTWFVAAFHSAPMHDPGLKEVQRPARVCVCKGASALPCLLSCCCCARRQVPIALSARRVLGCRPEPLPMPATGRTSWLRVGPGACPPVPPGQRYSQGLLRSEEGDLCAPAIKH